MHPRDPHHAWRLEREHLRTDLNYGEIDDTDDADPNGYYQRARGLEQKILITPPTTIEGLQVMLDILWRDYQRDDASDDVAEAYRLARGFLHELERALQSEGLLDTVLHAMWDYRVPSAELWRHHPAMPQDVRDAIAQDRRAESGE